jgi:hypothetical protein
MSTEYIIRSFYGVRDKLILTVILEKVAFTCVWRNVG